MAVMSLPHLVEKIQNSVNHEYKKINYKAEKIDIKQGYLEIVKQGMNDCVQYGSCQSLKYLRFSAGGKTGTAQWSDKKANHAWFTSFAPYNQPKIVVTILMEEGGEGARIAMPIAYEFLKWWEKKYLN